MKLKSAIVTAGAILGVGWLVYGRPRKDAPASSALDPAFAPTGNPSPAEAGAHKAARPIVREALKSLLGKEPTLAQIQYGQSIGFLESSYGKGWGKPPSKCVAAGFPMDVPGAQASNNWGAVQSRDGSGFDWCDSNPDGSVYKQKFRSYASPEEGARDKLAHTFKHRPSVLQALSDPGATVWRASLAMRRTKYYGSWCPKAVARYGASANKYGEPGSSGPARACEQEAAELHAKRAFGIINNIAAALGEKVAIPLGTYEDAVKWYESRPEYKQS